MNYKSYAKALFESFLEKEGGEFNVFFDNFIKELEVKKRITLLPKILAEVQKYIEIAKQKDVTEIVVRNKDEWVGLQEKLTGAAKEFNLEDVKIVENKNIVGGFILRNSKYILDKSYKKGLLKMYQKLIK